jgi:hypothetical protein
MLAFSPSALATPVTYVDLSGKKLCQDDGGNEKYRTDRKYFSSRDGTGTWLVASTGVQINSNQIKGLAGMQILPDGTFASTWMFDGKPKAWVGHYCQ